MSTVALLAQVAADMAPRVPSVVDLTAIVIVIGALTGGLLAAREGAGYPTLPGQAGSSGTRGTSISRA